MIWVLLLYVLPLVLSMLVAYFLIKKEGGSVKDFLEPLPFLFIPVMNIAALGAGLVIFIEKFLDEDESWQNFKNKKL